jgi:adenylate cyclase class IV
MTGDLPLETEVKIPVDKETFYRIYDQLYTPGFINQRNLIYSFGESFFRLRQELDKTILTVKGKRQEGEFNSRVEVESELAMNVFDELKAIIPNAFYYEKLRANKIRPHCTISFDELTDGRRYIEIEGSENEIRKHLSELGLANHPIEKRSYLELLGGVKYGLEKDR